MRLGQRAAEHGEVLAEHEHQPATDRTPAGDHAVAGDLLLGHAEIRRAVLDEHVPFLERALVEQGLDAFAGREFALGVLRLDALGAAAAARTRALRFELLQDFLHRGPLPAPVQLADTTRLGAGASRGADGGTARPIRARPGCRPGARPLPYPRPIA